jgi:molybdate transport system substrate-binding protein
MREVCMGRKRVIVFLVYICALLFLLRDAYPESLQEIMVSAAMSLKNPFDEIGRAFERKHFGVKVYFNFGASGDLKRQIDGGAPVDVFASAALQEMDELEKEDRIINGTRFNFAKNAIVLVKPVHSGCGITSFDGLKGKTVKKIGIVNPQTSPAGRYAEEVLKYFNLFDSVHDKLVFGEHVRQVLDYVARGEVDAGIVYITDAMLRSKEVRIIIQAPEKSHTPAVCPIAVVKGTKNEYSSREFVTFVASGEARKIFQKSGFKPLIQ